MCYGGQYLPFKSLATGYTDKLFVSCLNVFFFVKMTEKLLINHFLPPLSSKGRIDKKRIDTQSFCDIMASPPNKNVYSCLYRSLGWNHQQVGLFSHFTTQRCLLAVISFVNECLFNRQAFVGNLVFYRIGELK